MNILLEAFNNAKSGDEYYTKYRDIENELSHYNFSGMIVYCNCDNPSSSNFVAYFKKNFKALGLKCLLATFNDANPALYRYDGVKENYKSIASGRFQDNASIIRICDVVVTNPPFSNNMPAELIKIVIGAGKKFILVGRIGLGLRKDLLPLLLSGQLSCGYNVIRNFDTPTSENGKITTFWWTNMPVDKPELPLNANFDERIHQIYDNYNAINCDSLVQIPNNYNGAIGVPITFIRFFNPNQFNIHGVLNVPILNGKKKNSRIIISKK